MNEPTATQTPAAAELDAELVQRAFEGQAPAFLEQPDLLQRLNLIRHLIQSTRMTVLISGPEGAGKTACLDELQRGAEPRWLLCRIAGATTRDPDRALARLARCCDLPPDCGRPALRQLLAEHATVVSRSARLPVIAVDDAHGLEPDTLRELVALTSAEAGWRLLLMAEPGHEAHWSAAGLASAAQLHSLEWRALSASQTGAYVLHRLRGAGWHGPQPLSDEQIRKLHRDSAGLPGAINRLAPAMLVRQRPAARPAAAPKPRAGSGRTVRIAALVLVASVVGLVLWQQDRINALFQPADEPASATGPASPAPHTPTPAPTMAPAPDRDASASAPEDQPATEPGTPQPTALAEAEPAGDPQATPPGRAEPSTPPAEPTVAPDSARPGAPSESDNSLETQPLAPEQGPADVPAEPAPDPASQRSAALPAPESPALEPPVREPAVSQPSTPEAPQAADAEQAQPSGPDTSAPPEVTDAPAPIPESPALETPEPQSPAPETRAAEPSDSVPAATAARDPEPPPPTTAGPEPEQAPQAAAAPADPSSPAAQPEAVAEAPDDGGAGWVLAQDPSHYTLQLLGSRERKAVLEIIERFSLSADTAWYKIQYRGGDWYVLVHGAYPDSRAASRALARMPAGLRQAGPWPRPLSAVQTEIRRGRK